MIRNKIVFVFIFLTLLSLSCQEDFNPKTDFKEQYVLNCYVDLDYDYYETTTVYATISKLYDVSGFDPSQNKINPYVSWANICCYYRGDTYYLEQDTLKISKDTLIPPTFKYDTIQVYYKVRMRYIFPNYSISIKAVMPDGKVLSASTQLLEGLQLGFSYNFDRGFTTRINRFLFGNVFTISWGPIGGHLFFPQLLIPYQKLNDYTWYYKEVPCTYVKNNGQYEPVYPSYMSHDSISYDYSAIDSAMAQVSHSENFDNFRNEIIFQMVELDGPLSKYYESIHGSIDSYSISLDQSVYSNVSGGLGIFGSKRKLTKYWSLDPVYMVQFLKKK